MFLRERRAKLARRRRQQQKEARTVAGFDLFFRNCIHMNANFITFDSPNPLISFTA
jgi:hypothetical protein